MGKVYEAGDLCNEDVAAALGADAVLVDGEVSAAEVATQPVRATKPVKKASVKGLESESIEVET